MSRTAVCRCFVRCLLLLAVLTGSLYGDGLAQETSKTHLNSRVEVGAYVKWFNRDMSGDGERIEDDRWFRELAFIKVAPSSRISIQLAGMILGARVLDEYPDRLYRHTTIGVGADIYPITREQYSLRFNWRFHQSVSFDESPNRYHKRHHNLEFGLHLIRSFQLGSLVVDSWAGPAAVFDEVSHFRGLERERIVKSEDNLGFAVGGSSVVYGPFRVYAQMTHVCAWQTEGGIGYLF